MRRLAALSAAVVLAGACVSPRETAPAAERVEVVTVDLGRAVGPDKRVSAPADTFSPEDTIYASVVTEGKAPPFTLSARWSREGSTLEETAQRIAPEGTAVSEFHVTNPAGWAPGAYRVQVLLEGQVAAERAFRVEAPGESLESP